MYSFSCSKSAIKTSVKSSSRLFYAFISDFEQLFSNAVSVDVTWVFLVKSCQYWVYNGITGDLMSREICLKPTIKALWFAAGQWNYSLISDIASSIFFIFFYQGAL